ncbi:hypothetical protein FA15DRAFT_709599 [Coprinopsis marcescibilis]|uniref:Uncharacterized protein n=1 Tax=Coprinopsis marcescibilis TaxID=230819 RepID=A0A5C3KFB4_COPMA|nr:hypothetical protein FA15DRAFT_709599 [Coprinopsis marcescibilis]
MKVPPLVSLIFVPHCDPSSSSRPSSSRRFVTEPKVPTLGHQRRSPSRRRGQAAYEKALDDYKHDHPDVKIEGYIDPHNLAGGAGGWGAPLGGGWGGHLAMWPVPGHLQLRGGTKMVNPGVAPVHPSSV